MKLERIFQKKLKNKISSRYKYMENKIQDQKVPSFKKSMFVLFFLGLLIYLFSGEKKPDAPEIPDETDAFVYCQLHIKKALRSPASADFPSITADGNKIVLMKKGPPEWQYFVRSYVDSQNGFGAMIRTHFTCTMNKQPQWDHWVVEDVKLK
jgi:hypothetical protein